LGGLDQYDGLNLRRWAHMLGFRGHFLTKSQRYSWVPHRFAYEVLWRGGLSWADARVSSGTSCH